MFFFLRGRYWFMFLFFHCFVSWLFVCLAESNRSPFDFSEGESELVSGFNTEYSGGVFSLIFICEYGMVLILSFFTVLLFCGGDFMFFKVVGLVWFFV